MNVIPCSALTARKTPCKRKALPGTILCKTHTRMKQLDAKAKVIPVKATLVKMEPELQYFIECADGKKIDANGKVVPYV